ncbi:MAG: polymorphic toxin-type HINT domain-containing protein [Isosphaerales bacterium]
MVQLVLVAVGLVGFSPQESTPPSASDLKTYEAVRPKVRRDPAAHVKLALWCEAHGLDAERVRHLAQAVAIDPNHVTARGLLGLIELGGRWLSPEQVRDRRKSDQVLTAKLEQYHARRAALEGSLEPTKRGAADPRKASRAHEKLGVWCEEQGLNDQALAHFTMAVQLDPYHETTWKHLGYVKRRGRWMSREQIAADERETDAQRKADKHWEPLLRKWKGWLAEKTRRVEAEELLAKVVDSGAVRSIIRVFGPGPPDKQLIAASMLGRIDGLAASRELARLAVFNDSESVRRAATAALKGRVLRDYVGELIEMVQPRVVYQIHPVGGPGSTGALAIDTPRFHLVRTYDVPPAFTLARTFRGYVGYDPNGMPVVAPGIELDRLNRESPLLQAAHIMRLEAATQELFLAAAMAATRELVADVNVIESFNRESAAVNQRILPVLQSLAGVPGKKDDKDALNVWWYDQLGYQYEPPAKVTLVENVSPQYSAPQIYTCFAAGTLVDTPEGSRPIEQIHAGDLVLSQDVTTGALDYEPVLVVHHNKPSKTLRIRLTNHETVVSSIYHRFWRSGLGWALARELNPGDTLRILGGQVTVASIEPGDVVPVFNLDVARKRSFFAGLSGLLVHDNTLPEARLTPFDAPLTLKPAG